DLGARPEARSQSRYPPILSDTSKNLRTLDINRNYLERRSMLPKAIREPSYCSARTDTYENVVNLRCHSNYLFSQGVFVGKVIVRVFVLIGVIDVRAILPAIDFT